MSFARGERDVGAVGSGQRHEDTGLLAARYRALGGRISVIEKAGAGHRSGPDPSDPVIEFLLECATA